MRPALALALLVATAPLGAARADDAGDKAQARLLLAQGNTLYERGDVRGALANFRAAYALYPSPRLLVNVAVAERELGDLAAAANDLAAFLEEPDDDAALVERARTEMRNLLPRLARVGLQPGWPAGAVLEVDGRAAPPGTYVRPGDHRLRARTTSGRQIVERVQLRAGESLWLAPPPAPPRDVVVGVVGPRPGAVQPRRRAWIAGVVIPVFLVAGGVAVGLGVGLTRNQNAPLGGDLGTLKLSDFR